MIELSHIHRIFQVGDQAVHALQDVTLQIETADYVSIMGPSGSGKSTLLNIIGLLDWPTSGNYRLDDQDTATLTEVEQARFRREKIGFVFQFFHLVPRLTAAENIELPLMLAGMPPAERKNKVRHSLAAMSLTDRADHKPDQLSGGQRQRVAIGRATIMEPSILLADEPTGNLDSASGQEVLEVLESLNRQGITLMVVTHDPDIGSRTRRSIHMVDGSIASDERTSNTD
jgi:putative ABC transport system ATP-binding protein